VLGVFLEHLATVRAQKTAVSEPSITPAEYKPTHFEVETLFRVKQYTAEDNHRPVLVEQGIADINRRFHLVPNIFS
jgi:hypothetical protein